MADRPLKIMLCDPHSRGGGQVTYVSTLARELTARGHDIVIACRSGSVLVEAAAAAGCRCAEGFRYGGGARLISWYQDLSKMAELLRSFKPDILHVNGSQDHWTGALANVRLGRPAALVRTRHNTYAVKKSYANRKLNRGWTDFQIVVCDVVRKDLAKHPVFDARRLVTVHNGVHAEAFAPNAAVRTQAREEFGYGPEHEVVGIAARLVPAKGHEFLLKAVGQIHQQYPNLRLLLLGQGTLEESLKALAVKAGISGITQFAGFRSDMAYCVQALDIGAQPSIDCDTSSFSMKEQMAAEVPIVASDYGGLREIITDGMEGYVVPAGTVAPLASALRRLLDSQELRRKMGAAARKRVLREFSVEVFTDRTLKAYEKAIQVQRERSSSR